MVTKKKTASTAGKKARYGTLTGKRQPALMAQPAAYKVRDAVDYKTGGTMHQYLSTSQTRQAKNATKTALAAPKMSRNVSNAVRTRNSSSVAKRTSSAATSAATSASRKKKR